MHNPPAKMYRAAPSASTEREEDRSETWLGRSCSTEAWRGRYGRENDYCTTEAAPAPGWVVECGAASDGSLGEASAPGWPQNEGPYGRRTGGHRRGRRGGALSGLARAGAIQHCGSPPHSNGDVGEGEWLPPRTPVPETQSAKFPSNFPAPSHRPHRTNARFKGAQNGKGRSPDFCQNTLPPMQKTPQEREGPLASKAAQWQSPATQPASDCYFHGTATIQGNSRDYPRGFKFPPFDTSKGRSKGMILPKYGSSQIAPNNACHDASIQNDTANYPRNKPKDTKNKKILPMGVHRILFKNDRNFMHPVVWPNTLPPNCPSLVGGGSFKVQRTVCDNLPLTTLFPQTKSGPLGPACTLDPGPVGSGTLLLGHTLKPLDRGIALTPSVARGQRVPVQGLALSRPRVYIVPLRFLLV